MTARIGSSRADRAAGYFQALELEVDVGSLAIWAMGVSKEAISKHDAALTVSQAMKTPSQAAEIGPQGVAPGLGIAL